MNKKCVAFILLLFFCMLFVCCSNSKEQSSLNKKDDEAVTNINPNDSEPYLSDNNTPQIEQADGYLQIGGTWEVGGLYFEENLIKLEDYPGIKSMYSGVFLIFKEDGTFIYDDVFFNSGTYERLGNFSFLLKTDRVFRMDFIDGEVVEIEMENAQKTPHIVTLTYDGIEGLRYAKYDAFTGNELINSDILVFVKSTN